MLAPRLIPTMLLTAALLAVSFPAVADDADAGPTKLTPLQIGQIFCISRVGNDMAPVEAIVTPSLKQSIAKADARNAAWQKKNPGEKPPLGDGIGWQSSPDYADKCEIGLVTLSKTDAKVEIKYSFKDYPDGSYTDVLILKKVPIDGMDVGYWRIDDIVYPDGSDLKQGLITAFEPD